MTTVMTLEQQVQDGVEKLRAMTEVTRVVVPAAYQGLQAQLEGVYGHVTSLISGLPLDLKLDYIIQAAIAYVNVRDDLRSLEKKHHKLEASAGILLEKYFGEMVVGDYSHNQRLAARTDAWLGTVRERLGPTFTTDYPVLGTLYDLVQHDLSTILREPQRAADSGKYQAAA
ncbi:hypothetical protein COV20_01715 [Candidatus Woesearchaeota archaeon CG10_big_fil_rev_8_21_14_0_10_45_16]|nr:MAG: hypothetical protein COV20_01715 [Candidatus Woesearchaeota archaeon CG10_big_fil_rev_8_21_14_0_10_45_16]